MIEAEVLDEVSRIFSRAEEQVTNGLEEGEIETEPTFTDRLIGAIKMGVEEIKETTDSYRIRARTLRDRGPNAPETEFGADGVFILDVDTPEVKVRKGFLMQAKISGREGIKATVESVEGLFYNFVSASAECYPSSANSHPRSQCEDMLGVTHESFIFVYDKSGIAVIPALALTTLEESDNWRAVHAKPFQAFMADYLQCFVGDPKVTAHDDESLRRQTRLSYANSAFLLQIDSQ